MVTVDGSIWMFGGFHGGEFAPYSNALYKLDVDTATDQAWTTVTTLGPLPVARGLTGMAAVGFEFYMFGGMNENLDPADLDDGLWRFNTLSCQWTNLASSVQGQARPCRRLAHSMTTVGKDIYLLGGLPDSSSGVADFLGDFWCLNTTTLTWSQLENLPIEYPPWDFNMAAIDDDIHVYGCFGNSKCLLLLHRRVDVFELFVVLAHWPPRVC